jgi:hypothetical protein
MPSRNVVSSTSQRGSAALYDPRLSLRYLDAHFAQLAMDRGVSQSGFTAAIRLTSVRMAASVLGRPEQYENLVRSGVIDPAKVVRSALTERRVGCIAAADDRSGHLADSGREERRADVGRWDRGGTH